MTENKQFAFDGSDHENSDTQRALIAPSNAILSVSGSAHTSHAIHSSFVAPLTDPFAFDGNDQTRTETHNGGVVPSNASLSVSDGDHGFCDIQNRTVAPLTDPFAFDGDDQSPDANHARFVVPSSASLSINNSDHPIGDSQESAVASLTETPSTSGSDHRSSDTHYGLVAPLVETNPPSTQSQLSVDAHNSVACVLDGPSSTSGGNHARRDTHSQVVPPLVETNPSEIADHIFTAAQTGGIAISDGPSSASDDDHFDHDIHRISVTPLVETIDAIRAHHRERNHWMELRKRNDNSLGAFLRTQLGWSLAKPKPERDRIRQQAAEIIETATKYIKKNRILLLEQRLTGLRPAALPDVPDIVAPWAHVLVPQIAAQLESNMLEDTAKRLMEKLAVTLPVDPKWTLWAKGFGPLGLAIIIGETGDLSNYANPAKVWMRMGAGILDGRRQGAPGPKAKKSDWLKEKYSPVRRSRLVQIGESFVKCTDSPYREIYLKRKEYEREKAESQGLIVAPAAKIPKGRESEYRSLMHIHNRARRYAEKKLLRDLWCAWKRTP